MVKELQDINYERSAITTVLQDNSYIDTLIERVDEDYFVDSIAKDAFNWIKSRYMKNKKISIIQMKTNTDIDCETLVEHDIQIEEYESMLNVLEKYATRRKIANAARKAYKVTQQDGLEAEEYSNKAQDIMFNATDNNQKEKGVFHIEESLNKLFDDITAIQNGEKEHSGVPTGYPSIDNQISGLQDGHLTVVAAPTSMGKTAFSLSMVYNILLEGYKVAFISLEMVHTEISQRLMCIDSKVPANKYRKKMADYVMKNVNASLSNLMDKNMYISDTRGLTTADIKARCRNISNKMEGIDFVVVDYLQNIKLNEGNKNTAGKIGDVTLDLRNLAGELECPVLLLSQVNRKTNGVPKLSHLRGSGRIEENADEVWFTYRPEYEEGVNNREDKEEAQIIMAKGRTTGTGVVDFVWYPQILYWRDEFLENKEGPLELIV